MIKVNVELSDEVLSQIRAALAGFTGSNGGKVAPRTAAAFKYAARLVQKSWQNWAMGGSIAGADNIKNPNPRLAGSIKIHTISDFEILIGTDSRYMERIQKGSPGFDMKDTHPYGRKSRVSKEKIPYLIVPFRWGTPNKNGGPRAHFANVIPEDIYAIVKSKKFKKSEKTSSTHTEPNYNGDDVDRAEYNWGDRISNDAGTASGMVKMRDSGKSTYFTFRVISAKSPADSWIRKEVPPNDVVGALEKSLRGKVNDIIQAGLEQELGL